MVQTNQLHIIGTTSVFIAIKYLEVSTIRMVELLDDVCHNKFSHKEILSMEKQILYALGFKIQDHNLYEDVIVELR